MDRNDSETRSGVTMGSDYWISYTDIMTALLFIFILIVFFFIFNYRGIIANYISKSDLKKNYISRSELGRNYISKSELDNNYISRSDLNSKYISLSQYNRLVDINNDIRNKNYLLEQENKIIKDKNNIDSELLTNYYKLLAENKKYKQINEEGFVADRKIIELLKHIRDELNNDYGIRVGLDETNKTLSIDSTVLGFKSGRHEITEENYKRHVHVIGNVIQNKLRNYLEYIDAIFIEGYTDDQRLDKSETFGNWGLSALRAISFWYSLKNDFPSLSRLRSANGKKLLLCPFR